MTEKLYTYLILLSWIGIIFYIKSCFKDYLKYKKEKEKFDDFKKGL